jgi:hypothetical protein
LAYTSADEQVREGFRLLALGLASTQRSFVDVAKAFDTLGEVLSQFQLSVENFPWQRRWSLKLWNALYSFWFGALAAPAAWKLVDFERRVINWYKYAPRGKALRLPSGDRAFVSIERFGNPTPERLHDLNHPLPAPHVSIRKAQLERGVYIVNDIFFPGVPDVHYYDANKFSNVVNFNGTPEPPHFYRPTRRVSPVKFHIFS